MAGTVPVQHFSSLEGGPMQSWGGLSNHGDCCRNTVPAPLSAVLKTLQISLPIKTFRRLHSTSLIRQNLSLLTFNVFNQTRTLSRLHYVAIYVYSWGKFNQIYVGYKSFRYFYSSLTRFCPLGSESVRILHRRLRMARKTRTVLKN